MILWAVVFGFIVIPFASGLVAERVAAIQASRHSRRVALFTACAVVTGAAFLMWPPAERFDWPISIVCALVAFIALVVIILRREHTRG